MVQYEIQCVCNTVLRYIQYSSCSITVSMNDLGGDKTAKAYWIPMPDKHKHDPTSTTVCCVSPIVR